MRSLKLVDSAERIYDSCLPSYSAFFKNEPDVEISERRSIYGIPLKDHEVISFDGRPGQGFESGSLYSNQFPFQDNPTRNLTLVGTIMTGSGFIFGSDQPSLFTSSPVDIDVNVSAADFTYRVGSTTQAALAGSTHQYKHRTGRTILGPVSLSRNPVLGPFRYGISNTKPEFTASRWRPDHYGHFRDMLEPRQHAATFDGVKPVKIRFVSGSSTVIDPTNTHSQNLSIFATSSMPYFDDGIARNRDDNPDETLLSV